MPITPKEAQDQFDLSVEKPNFKQAEAIMAMIDFALTFKPKGIEWNNTTGCNISLSTYGFIKSQYEAAGWVVTFVTNGISIKSP